jgi:hypothetical protein
MHWDCIVWRRLQSSDREGSCFLSQHHSACPMLAGAVFLFTSLLHHSGKTCTVQLDAESATKKLSLVIWTASSLWSPIRRVTGLHICIPPPLRNDQLAQWPHLFWANGAFSVIAFFSRVDGCGRNLLDMERSLTSVQCSMEFEACRTKLGASETTLWVHGMTLACVPK